MSPRDTGEGWWDDVMGERRPTPKLLGLPTWAWVVGSLVLVLATLYGSFWLPELRERMAVRYLNRLPDCQVEKLSGGFYQIAPRFHFLPDHAWLAWIHRLAPPAAYGHDVTIGPRFPLAELKRLRALRSGYSFNASGTDFSDEHIPDVTIFSRLVLNKTRISDSGLKGLAGEPLFELSVADTRVGDAGIRFLKSRNHLVTLDLSGTRITDAGLAHLAALSDVSPTELILDRTQIGDEGLRALLAETAPESFDVLSLSGTRVTWEYIETWQSTPRLLSLAGLDIPDRAADWFVIHEWEAQEVDLSDSQLTDIGLAVLEQCAALRKLRIRNCAITESAATHFMESHADEDQGFPDLPPLADRIRNYRETGWLER